MSIDPKHWQIGLVGYGEVGRILAEAGRPDSHLASACGIEPDWLSRYPHELSGGMAQRAAISRPRRSM